jgi:hypothetical protein
MLPLNDYSLSDAKSLQITIQAVKGSKRMVTKAVLVGVQTPTVD